LSASVGRLFAVAENYPALQANAAFLDLQKRTTELESQIADRREFYNDAINVFNTRIQEMPDIFVARLFGMRPRLMFLVTAAEKAPARLVFDSRQP
jgi:LemA protein